MTTAVQRFIDLTPRGALMCAVRPSVDVQGRLLHALLQREPGHQWDREEFMRLLPRDSEDAPRALFSLHRQGCIDVSVKSPPLRRQRTSLQSDLESMIEEGATLAALLDRDGLIIAQAGASHVDNPVVLPPTATVQAPDSGSTIHSLSPVPKECRPPYGSSSTRRLE